MKRTISGTTLQQRRDLAACMEPDQAFISPELRETMNAQQAETPETWVDAQYRRIG